MSTPLGKEQGINERRIGKKTIDSLVGPEHASELQACGNFNNRELEADE